MALPLLLPVSLLLPLWAGLMLRLAGGPRLPLEDLRGGALAAAAGYAAVLLVTGLGSHPYTVPETLVLCLFGALALLSAWIDHRTAWAPDGLILPLLTGALLVGALLGTGPASVIGAPVIALAIFLFAQGLWAAQCLLGPRLLTPPDQIVLALPFLVFGLTPYAPVTWALICLPVLILMRVPEPVYLRLRGPAAREAARDAGLSGSGRSAPLLPVVLTTLLGVLLFRLYRG
jgi:hypothetical protein